MKLKAIDHITINVTRLEEEKAFYENVLGLEPCGFIDMGDHTLTYYALPGGVRLELINYEQKDEPSPGNVMHVGMYRHFCLTVDSLEDYFEKCRAHGARVTSEPAYVERLGCRNMLVIDPSGVEIEFFEEH